ncbi:hypothetical protein [Aquiflexum sp.]|uniref:hypothetical protein n=1 Tax=Aquiflexum sp. TaxID=1872584 RepID=UPI0035942E82
MQVPLKILIISLSFLLSHLGHCQITDKELGKTPSNYTILLHSRENEKGLLMSYKEFKNGSIIEASEKEKNTLMTTMLLGSATSLYNYLSHTYSDFKPVVIKPNGFTTTSFQIKYEFSEGSIYITRIFKNQSGLNLMAAEDPNNYILLYGFDIKDQKISNEIIDHLTRHLKSSNIEFGRVDRKK